MFFSKVKIPTEVVVPERRRSLQQTAIMQVAKIWLDGGREELCLLRDIAPEGLKAEIYVPAEASARVRVELRTGRIFDGQISWIKDGLIGMAFDIPVPMSELLLHCSLDDRLGILRPPRLTVNMNGLLRVGGEERSIHIGNVSQAGTQIVTPQPLEPNTPCAIAFPGLMARGATIRWWRDGEAGLLLEQPFDYPEFAEWRAIVAA